MRKYLPIRAALVASLLVLCSAVAVPAGAQAPRESAERILFDAANRDREARQLRPLRWDNSLANGARQHAQRMAQQNTLAHQLPGEEDFKARALRAGARFSSLAENIAEGPNVPGIHTQWMNSPPHRENLLDPKLDSIGIAVAERGGEIFAVEDFSLAVADLSLEEQELQVSSLLMEKGLLVLNDVRGHHSTDARVMVNQARSACAQETGLSNVHRPAFLVRYTTADLAHLPQSLSQEIRKGQLHSAAVGACTSNKKSDFSSYRLAVLLYE
jgi:hypothetical protein